MAVRVAPPGWPARRCPERCGAHVVQATTVNGLRLWLDAMPDPAGNQAVSRDATGRINTRQLKAGEDPASWERRMMPHRPTCARRRAEQAAGVGDGPLADVINLAARRVRRRHGLPRRKGGT